MKISKSTIITGVLMYPPELRFTSFGQSLLTMQFLSEEHAEAWDQLAEQMADDERLFETGRIVTVTGKSRKREWKTATGDHEVNVLTIESYDVQA